MTNIKTIKFPTRMTLTFDAIKCVAMHPEASFQEILERIGRAQNTSRGVINRYLNHHGVTQVDGKWVVPAGLRAHVMRGDKKKLKTDYSTWVGREPYVMPPPLSMRLGANDMRDVKSLKP